MILPAQTNSLNDFLKAGPYVGYSYSYPHKTAYRQLNPVRQLADVWQNENRDHLFLYVHVPFCEMRCGFCNLFTFSQPKSEVPTQYLQKIHEQAKVIKQELGDFRFELVAIGGGTPTFLSEPELEQLFSALGLLGVTGSATQISIEASPATISPSKLAMLKANQIHRISMGIQSFSPKDAGMLGRPQQIQQVHQAIEWIREKDFPIFNVDLIYGGAEQSVASWLDSLKEAISFQPDEVFLYPLYVRPLTGLGNRNLPSPQLSTDLRLEMYQEGRQFLLSHGYQQNSMRMFYRPESSATKGLADSTPDSTNSYRCQRDGMIGLGVGARSYTSELHYSSRYAVRQSAIGKIINDYIQQPTAKLAEIDYGIPLSANEQLHRQVVLTLLQAEGMDCEEFQSTSGLSVRQAFPQINQLEANGLAIQSGQKLKLTERGLAYSDSIGPWLYSNTVKQRMKEFAWDSV